MKIVERDRRFMSDHEIMIYDLERAFAEAIREEIDREFIEKLYAGRVAEAQAKQEKRKKSKALKSR